MKVYLVDTDIKNYQFFCIDDDSWTLEDGTFDSRNRLSGWKMPNVYIDNPKAKRGNFFYVFGSPGTFVVDTTAKDALEDLFERSGELLPFVYKDEQFFVFNAIECVNVFDETRATCKYHKGSQRILEIISYAFHKRRFHETPLFKIPETCETEVLTYTGLNMAPEEMFKTRVEESGLTGLIFKELWDDCVDD